MTDDNRDDMPERDPPKPGEEFATIPGITAQADLSLSLTENLERTGRHPVLIFGSSMSGKSSLILSFIRVLQAARSVDVELGEPVLDRADPKAEEKHRLATRFYDWQTYMVDRGKSADATQDDPFFVPIDIKPTNSLLPPVKLAFLDSRGERWVPSNDPTSDFYKPFSPEIAELLERFSYGISVVCVAPYSVSPGHDRDTRESNFGLLGAMREYRRLRKLRRNDFHLFLLTKWDQYAPPLDPKPLFDNLYPEDVDKVLCERYEQAWGDFQALPLEGPAHDRRAFMQFSAGYFVDGRPRPAPGSFAASFNRYPRTVLNWLYGNATQFNVSAGDREYDLRKILFEDVVAPSEPRVTLTDRLAALLTSQ